ncbi:MAG: hypothetical protein K0V04_43860 [Deltaproteobacteria bacterium]|nr:hypothetical protein [Deltaproteobacteria bacterium]
MRASTFVGFALLVGGLGCALDDTRDDDPFASEQRRALGAEPDVLPVEGGEEEGGEGTGTTGGSGGSSTGASCDCPLDNPDAGSWCVGSSEAVCTLGACYKTAATGANCAASYTGSYCGCHLESADSEFVGPPVAVPEADCTNVGGFTATKLYKKKDGDTAVAGYEQATCDWS